MRIADKLTNTLVILTSVAVLIFVADDFSGKRLRRMLAPKPPPPDWSQVQLPAEIVPAQGAKTVLLVLSTQCSVCVREIPKYRELAQRMKSDAPTAKFAAVFVQSHQEAEQFLKQEGLNVPAVDVPSLIKAVRATPTIVLIDDRGKVQEFWVGAGAISTERLVAELRKG